MPSVRAVDAQWYTTTFKWMRFCVYEMGKVGYVFLPPAICN